MNKIFSFRRFSKYLAYDLNNARNNFGLSMLVIGLLPVIVFAFTQFVVWIFGPDDIDSSFGIANRVMALFVAYIVVLLRSCSKLYGKLTERRYGSDWLLVPASTFEKWLSMILVVCVFVPLVFFVLLVGCDSLLALIFPARYGETLFSLIGTNPFSVNIDDEVTLNVMLPLYMSWISSSLYFLLGSLIFRKAKIAKTMLVCMALGMVFSMCFASVFQYSSLPDYIEEIFDSPYQAIRWINAFFNITFFVQAIPLAIGIYFRLKTLKH